MNKQRISYQWVKCIDIPNTYKLESDISTQNCKIRRDISSDKITMIELVGGPYFDNNMLIDGKRIINFEIELGQVLATCTSLF